MGHTDLKDMESTLLDKRTSDACRSVDLISPWRYPVSNSESFGRVSFWPVARRSNSSLDLSIRRFDTPGNKQYLPLASVQNISPQCASQGRCHRSSRPPWRYCLGQRIARRARDGLWETGLRTACRCCDEWWPTFRRATQFSPA